jgi:uncharacterized membrane protein
MVSWRTRRLLAKTVSYRLTSVAVTAVVTYLLVGSLEAALGVGVAANALKTGVYYAHERAWAARAPPEGAVDPERRSDAPGESPERER